MSAFAHSNFGWIDEQNASSNTDLVLASNSEISFNAGATVILNNSVTTNLLNVTTIQNNSNPVDFPDGLQGDPIYYNNAYELTAGLGNTHHNEVYFNQNLHANASVLVDTIAPNNNNATTFTGNVIINQNLSVLGNTTTIASTNTSLADRFIALNSNYAAQSPISSGIITSRSPTTIYALGANFLTTTTVDMAAPTGLGPEDIFSIIGSISNDGIYECLDHVGSILTIKTAAAPFCNNIFVIQAATGSAQLLGVSILEIDSTGAPIIINGNNTTSQTHRNIAYDTSSPTFNDLACDTLNVESATLNNALTKIMMLDNSGNVRFREASSIGGAGIYSTEFFVMNVDGCGLPGDGSHTISIAVRRDGPENLFLEFGAFSDITTVTAGPHIRFNWQNSAFLEEGLYSGFVCYVDGQIEELYAVHLASTINLYRKNYSNFPAGIVIRNNSAPPAGPLLRNYIKFNKY